MYCVIQEIENKKPDTNGGYKKLEVDVCKWFIDNEKPSIYYGYKYGSERFERHIKTAYKISIHKSYREHGRVRKKQWVICTIPYYSIVGYGSWIGDYITGGLKDKLKDIGITEDELCNMVYDKFQPIIDVVTKEFEATEEYKTKVKHNAIIAKYTDAKCKFEHKYGKSTYDYCYDVFGVLRNEEYLKELEANYKVQQEYNRSYYENFKSNYNNYDFGGYSNLSSSTYTDNEKDNLKRIYRVLAAKFHPDISKDDGEMMKLVNKLKEDWDI